MSGIVGIVHLDETPIEAELLGQLTGFLEFRGPDAQRTWIDGSVGFGHTLLATTDEAAREDQPVTLDGQVWLVADARIDAQGDLRQKLAGKGRDVRTEATDPELILHAYHAWADDCVEHLLGDFAFAIWDGRRKRLFCARDHFGVKPFYYAKLRNGIVFSNTLDCLRLHPGVSDRLNDLAIADFLLFGHNQELDTTTFADIRALAPAHTLVVASEQCVARRYWSLEVGEEIRYFRERDYVERFQELMDAAVEDRARTNRVSILLSGGIDSATIAASAVSLRSRRPALSLRGCTVVFDRVIPDRERHFTSLTASALGIPIDYIVGDQIWQTLRVDEIESPSSEPDSCLTPNIYHHYLPICSDHARVIFNGSGGDEGLRLSGCYLLSMLSKGRLVRLVSDIGRTLLSHRRMPNIGLRSTLKRILRRPEAPQLPTWLSPDLVARLDLSKRLRDRTFYSNPLLDQRGWVKSLFASSLIPVMFSGCDPGVTRYLIEFRYPFFDLRVLTFLMSLPGLPWCFDKHILRSALRGKIPGEVRQRPKTPLQADPLVELAKQNGLPTVGPTTVANGLMQYLQPTSLDPSVGRASPNDVWINYRPRKLNSWMVSLQRNQVTSSVSKTGVFR
jgi:asparagine synthase (glutamine-hydrolysing)